MLPKLAVPTFNLELPSTGQTVKFRPYLVKEEKILYMAQEAAGENAGKEIIDAIKSVISACDIETKLKINDLPIFDLEWIIIKLRAQSFSDMADISFQHTDCNCLPNIPRKTYQTKINLNEFQIMRDPEHQEKIMLDENIGVIMKYSSASQDEASLRKFKSKAEASTDILAACIDKIFDANDVYPIDNIEELKTWINDLPTEALDKMVKFLSTAPKILYKFKHTCEECNKEEEITIEGLQSFFG